MELNRRQLKPLDFTFDGRKVSARKIPLSLGSGIFASDDGAEVRLDGMAEIIARCVVFSDTSEPVFASAADVLDSDMDAMTALFRDVAAFSATSFEDAEKN